MGRVFGGGCNKKLDFILFQGWCPFASLSSNHEHNNTNQMNKPVHIGLSLSSLWLSWDDFLDDTSTNHPKSIYSWWFRNPFCSLSGFESVPIGLGVVSLCFKLRSLEWGVFGDPCGTLTDRNVLCGIQKLAAYYLNQQDFGSSPRKPFKSDTGYIYHCHLIICFQWLRCVTKIRTFSPRN